MLVPTRAGVIARMHGIPEVADHPAVVASTFKEPGHRTTVGGVDNNSYVGSVITVSSDPAGAGAARRDPAGVGVGRLRQQVGVVRASDRNPPVVPPGSVGRILDHYRTDPVLNAAADEVTVAFTTMQGARHRGGATAATAIR